MRKLRQVKSKRKNTWTDLRIEIQQLCERLNISSNDFKPININDWEKIEKSIWDKFSTYPPSNWIWNSLNCPSESAPINYQTFNLNHIIPTKEKVWYILEETVNEKSKFWCYEGTVEAVNNLFLGSSFSNEVIIVSKKLKWLLTIDHHDNITGTGELMKEVVKLKQ